MNEDVIADLWNVSIEHILESKRADVATDFVNTLLDHGIKESTLEALKGVDSYLDEAIEYAIDDEDYDEDYGV